MSGPKFTRIVQAVAARVATISQADGFFTDIGFDVRLDLREPQVDDLPAALVFAGPRTVESTTGCNSRVEMEITVMGYMPRKADDFLIVGDEIQSDIQRAVEIDDASLSGLLRRQYGLQFASSEIFMPEIGANAVGARVTYTAPHVRVTGDPEIE